MKKREAIKIMAAGAAGLGLLPSIAGSRSKMKLKGNIKHSASRWCYGAIPLEDFCKSASEIGLVGIDLLKPSQWETVQSFGLRCTMGNPEEFSLTEGFNNPELHPELQDKYSEVIEKAANLNVENLVCFSGNRREGLSEQQGQEFCAKGLEPLVKLAEERGVTLQMELLNSKVDHAGYQCDHTVWGVGLCKLLGSERFKLLYDIYHMQIMEGDIIATIREYHPYFGHYHTGGVPGRNEINDTQELNYSTIMKAIVKTGYRGYVAQEFIPTRENILDSLKESIEICDV